MTQLYNCCTLSDYNYILKGLVLYDSLEKNTKEDFTLYYLCLDDKTFETLTELELKYLIPINLKEIEYNSPKLQFIKQVISYREYCFLLSSYFTWYILKNYDIEGCLYIDSDIVFYRSLKRVFDTVKDKSIGFISHRHLPFGCIQGYFNVGIVYFSGDVGLHAVNFWKDLMLDPGNKYSQEYGTTGDQKYLELLYKSYEKDVRIIDEDGIGYSAPYNLDLYDYSKFDIENKEIIWKGNSENLVFCHFIKFHPDFNNNIYRGVETQQEWNKLSQIKEVKQMYDEYFEYNKEIYKRYLE